MESKDALILAGVGGVLVLAYVYGEELTKAIRDFFEGLAPASGGNVSGPPYPRAIDSAASGRISGRVLDFSRTVGGWEASVEVTNGRETDATVVLQFVAKQNWIVGVGADEVIDLSKSVTIPADSTVPVTFTDRDLLLSLWQNYSVWLYADGVQIDFKE